MNEEDKKLALLLQAVELTFNAEKVLKELWENEMGTGTPSHVGLWTWGLANKYVKFKHYIVASIALPDLLEKTGMDESPFKFEFKDWKYT